MSKPLLNKWLWLQSFHFTRVVLEYWLTLISWINFKQNTTTSLQILPIPCLHQVMFNCYNLNYVWSVSRFHCVLKAPNSKLSFWLHDRWIITEFLAFLPDNSKSDQTYCCFRRLQFTTVSRQTTWVVNCHLFQTR